MLVETYLNRIGYGGSREPTSETLRELHLAHLSSVPFENLDIPRRPIVLDEEALFAKIVEHRRGGFCYELNGLFAALLRDLGFRVTLLSARVPNAEGRPVPEFDHLVLRVDLAEPWLADVGFGDCFRLPLRLDERGPQAEGARAYAITPACPDLVLRRHDPARSANGGDAWQEQYRFTLQPRRWDEFAGMCRYHQTAPESPFTRRRVCTLATPDGRVTISDDRLIITSGDQRHERVLVNEAEYEDALRQHFRIELRSLGTWSCT
jgi:N-hydroxyarylamine O-acetyltransferase